MKSKASVVRAALQILREQLDRERLHYEIRESVRKCARADRKENLYLAAGGIARKRRLGVLAPDLMDELERRMKIVLDL